MASPGVAEPNPAGLLWRNDAGFWCVIRHDRLLNPAVAGGCLVFFCGFLNYFVLGLIAACGAFSPALEQTSGNQAFFER